MVRYFPCCVVFFRVATGLLAVCDRTLTSRLSHLNEHSFTPRQIPLHYLMFIGPCIIVIAEE